VELDPPTARDSSLWNWKHDSQLREVQANIPDLALIELGATTADSYRLRATINKTNWNGQTGLFWGHRPVNGGAVLAAWQAVTIHAFPQDGKTKVRIHYEAYHREHDPRHKYPRVFSDRIALKDLDTPPLFDNELEVRIVKGRLVSVTWRGVEVPELSRIAEPGVSGASRSGGSFGLYVANGATVFRDARFRLDNEGND
jgi:hypothetical protein